MSFVATIFLLAAAVEPVETDIAAHLEAAANAWTKGEACFAYRITPPIETKVFPDERFLMGGEVSGVPIYGLQYTHVEASEKLKCLTKAYLHRLGLAYGAFDIVIDGEDYIFIECNPEGQWFAANRFNIDEVIEQFSACLVDRLTERAERRS